MKTFSKRSFVLLALTLAFTSLTLTTIPLASAQIPLPALNPVRFNIVEGEIVVKSKTVWKFSSDGEFTVDEIDSIVFYYTPTGGGLDQAVSVRHYHITTDGDVVIVLNAQQLPETAEDTYVIVNVGGTLYRADGPGFAWGWRW